MTNEENVKNCHFKGFNYDELTKEITCSTHTASDSPPAATDTLLGWKSIFTTSEALKSSDK